MNATLEQWVTFDPLADESFQHTRLGEPLADYLASKTSAGRAAGTLRDKRVYISSFAAMWPNVPIEDVQARHVVHWIAEMVKAGASPETIRVRRSHLNDFFVWAVKWDLIAKNPLDRLEPARRGAKRTYDIFTDAEIAALTSLPLLDGALMLTMLDAGLRRSECCKLRPRDIQPEPKPGQLVILDAKGGKDRLVPMTNRLSRSLAILHSESGMRDTDFFWYTRVSQGRTIKRHRPIGDGSFQRWWKRSLEEAGVRYRNPHMTRHSFAVRWLRRGGRLETLSLIMGHSSIAITFDLYGHLDTSDVFVDLAVMGD